MEKSSESTFSLKHLAQIFFRQRWAMVITFFSVMSLVVLVTLLMKKTYISEAEIFVRLGRENVALDPTTTLGQGPAVRVPQSREEEINSNVKMLQSRDIISKVVDYFSPQVILDEKSFDPSEAGKPPAKKMQGTWTHYQAVRTLNENLSISPSKKSNIIQISYEASSPELAQAVVGKVIDFYKDLHLELHRTPGGFQFFKEQKEVLKNKLLVLEEEYQSLKTQTGLYLLEDQRKLLVKRINDLETDLAKTRADLATGLVEVKQLEEVLKDLPPTEILSHTKGLPNQAMDLMKSKLFDLQTLEMELLTKHPENHPKVIMVRKQVVAAKKLLETEKKSRETTNKGPNRVYQETRLALFKQKPLVTSLKEKVAFLQKEIKQEKEKLKKLDLDSVLLTKLKREVDLEEERYKTACKNLAQAQIDQNMQTDRISNISKAQTETLELKPIRPKLSITLGIAFVLGLSSAVVVAGVRERADHTIKSGRELEKKLGAPVLTTIPKLTPDQLTLKNPDGTLDPGQAVQKECNTFFFDLVKKLPLSNETGEAEKLVLGVTSRLPGEGVSTVVSHLAVAASARPETKILVVDLNLSDPQQYKLLGCEEGPGFTDMVELSVRDTIQNTPLPNLFLLTRGICKEVELKDSTFLSNLIEGWKTNFDLVVLDLPATANNQVTLPVSVLLDGMVVVVEAERNPCENLQAEMELLTGADAQVIGTVLNKQKDHLPNYISRLF